MVRREEIELVRDSLAMASKILAGRADPKGRLDQARGRVVWMTAEYMPTKGAATALAEVKDALWRLADEPPEHSADLIGLRRAIAALLEVIDGQLRPGKPDRSALAKKWYATFWAQPETTVEIPVDNADELSSRFDGVAAVGHLDRRRVKGMWIVDHATEQDEVIRIHGVVPALISGRFYAIKRRQE